jgi:hypothetical protein
MAHTDTVPSVWLRLVTQPRQGYQPRSPCNEGLRWQLPSPPLSLSLVTGPGRCQVINSGDSQRRECEREEWEGVTPVEQGHFSPCHLQATYL